MSVDPGKLKAMLSEHGQEHVLAFWEELGDEGRSGLARQIEGIDFDLFDRLVARYVTGEGEAAGAGDSEITPAEFIPVPMSDAEKAAEAEAAAAGEEALRAGRVAAFVVAGGQGTRLGFDGPKGAYPIGPVTGRTLFQVHAEKILAASRAYGVTIPWFVMTSEANHDDTVGFLSSHSFFGMEESDVFCFRQRMIPGCDPEGRMYLAAKDRIFTNPNGHGGSLQALHESGALAEMKRRGIDVISYFQVDNPLVKVIDPVFIGRHLQAGAEMSSKVVSKAGPEEKVGVVGYIDGKLGVIEYSDLPEELMHATNDDGSLVFDGGSIAIHILSAPFVERMNEGGLQLPYHKAQKKISYVDGNGELVEPDGKNGVKFETFVFDALGFAKASVTMQVDRSVDFSPVKNATGVDSAETSRRDLTELYARWIEEAGGTVERTPDGLSKHRIEISPLFATGPDDLKKRVPEGCSINGDSALNP